MHDSELNATSERGLRAWDLPTRLFHWSIVILVGLAWWSAEVRLLDWHRRAGYAVLTLLIFRMLWGFCGSRNSRFASFCKSPAHVARYVCRDMFSRNGTQTTGHNPLGGWSVMTMLGTMLLQTSLGLIAVDVDGIESGPLSHLVDFETGRIAATIHHYVFNILLGLIGLHIVAIVFYHFYKKQNLTRLMITGRIVDGKPSSNSPAYSSVLSFTLFFWSVLFVVFLTMIIGR